jgi:hypothetical protein
VLKKQEQQKFKKVLKKTRVTKIKSAEKIGKFALQSPDHKNKTLSRNFQIPIMGR